MYIYICICYRICDSSSSYVQNEGFNNVLSGRHSNLILMTTHQSCRLLNNTMSDKVSVMIGHYIIYFDNILVLILLLF